MFARALFIAALSVTFLIGFGFREAVSHGFPPSDEEKKREEPGKEEKPERVEKEKSRWSQPYSLKEVREILGSTQAQDHVRQKAIQALSQWGDKAVEATPTLAQLIGKQREDFELRRRAVSILADLESTSEQALKKVFSVYADKGDDLDLRKAILMAWGNRPEYREIITPFLLQVLQDTEANSELRRQTAFVLRNFEEVDTEVQTAFLNVLGDRAEPGPLRKLSMEAIRAHGRASERTLSVLRELLISTEEAIEFRKAALKTLDALEGPAEKVVAILINLVKKTDLALDLRKGAVSALQAKEITDRSRQAILLDRVLDRSEAPSIRKGVTRLLQGLGSEAASKSDELWQTFQSTKEPRTIREFAGRVLTRIGADMRPRLSELVALAGQTEAPTPVRALAAQMIRDLDEAAKPALPKLLRILKDQSTPEAIKSLVAATLGPIAQTFLSNPNALDRAALQQRIDRLTELSKAIASAKGEISGDAVSDSVSEVERALSALRAEWDSRWWYAILNWEEDHRILSNAWVRAGGGLLVLLILLSGVWQGMTAFAPTLISRINETLRPMALPLGNGRRFGLNNLLLVSRWDRHPRVLDGWVRQHAATARRSIAQSSRGQALQPYISTPVSIQDEPVHSPDAHHWRSLFDRDMVYMVIHGDRGSGKTMLAHQLALQGLSDQPERRLQSHCIFPVWIDKEAEQQIGSNGQSLLRLMRDRFVEMIDQANELSEARFVSLLRQSRVLLIADGFSEWIPAARDRFVDAVKEAAIPFVVITSRHFHDGEKNRTHRVETLRLDSTGSSRFIEAYLQTQGTDTRFTSTELLEASHDLANMMSGRTLPSQVIRIYADFLAQEKEQSVIGQWPQSLTEVMLGYLKHLNWRAGAEWLNVPTLDRFFRLLAWSCVKERYAAGSTSLETVREQLPDDENLQDKIDLFVKNGILSSEEPEGNRITFTEAPVAEHLAAYHAVMLCQNDAESWRHFFEEADSKERSQILDFLQAVEDCCFNGHNLLGEIQLPGFVRDELDQRIGINDAQKEARLQKRVYSLLKQLLTHDSGERNQIIDELKQIGPKGKSVVPHLLETFRNRKEDLEVRQSAIQALGALESATPSTLDCLLDVIRDKEEHLFFRTETLEVLARISRGESEVISVLGKILTDRKGLPFFRSKIAETLGNMGEHAKEAIPYLDDVLHEDKSTEVQNTAKRVKAKIEGSG